MTDSIPSAAANLRAKSDALLKRCGWKTRSPLLGSGRTWVRPGTDRQAPVIWEGSQPHPYESIDDAVRLAEAMGMKVADIIADDDWSAYRASLYEEGEGPIQSDWQPTIAAAICAAIEEAVG